MVRSKTPTEVEWAIHQLQANRNLTGRCPCCEQEYPLADWFLFYGDAFPPQADDVLKEYYVRPDVAKEQYLKLRQELTTKTAERSVRVKVGQVLEQIVPALPAFPYAGNDCRSLFKPIDYIVFEGLTQNEVDSIHFVDVKTGKAGMNDNQKEIRRIIDKKRVEFERY